MKGKKCRTLIDRRPSPKLNRINEQIAEMACLRSAGRLN
jgi:hypothetical protein